MLLTILLSIFDSLFTILLEALHIQHLALKRYDKDMAKFLAQNSGEIDGRNLNAKVPIRLAINFTKQKISI